MAENDQTTTTNTTTPDAAAATTTTATPAASTAPAADTAPVTPTPDAPEEKKGGGLLFPVAAGAVGAVGGGIGAAHIATDLTKDIKKAETEKEAKSTALDKARGEITGTDSKTLASFEEAKDNIRYYGEKKSWDKATEWNNATAKAKLNGGDLIAVEQARLEELNKHVKKSFPTSPERDLFVQSNESRIKALGELKKEKGFAELPHAKATGKVQKALATTGLKGKDIKTAEAFYGDNYAKLATAEVQGYERAAGGITSLKEAAKTINETVDKKYAQDIKAAEGIVKRLETKVKPITDKFKTEQGAFDGAEKTLKQLKATDAIVKETGTWSHFTRPVKMLREATTGRKLAIAGGVALGATVLAAAARAVSKGPSDSQVDRLEASRANDQSTGQSM